MAKDLNKALEAVEMTYGQIKQIADDMVAAPFAEVNRLYEEVSLRVDMLSIEALREYLLKLQLAAFGLSEMRDRAGAKATCAEAVRKEAYAVSYANQEGTAAAKDSATTLAIAENIVAQCLYDLVAALVKTKLDSTHRLIDTLKSILMSRMQEAKMSNSMLD
jgi:hypothetical protein